jgi:hypothetical protein
MLPLISSTLNLALSLSLAMSPLAGASPQIFSHLDKADPAAESEAEAVEETEETTESAPLPTLGTPPATAPPENVPPSTVPVENAPVPAEAVPAPAEPAAPAVPPAAPPPATPPAAVPAPAAPSEADPGVDPNNATPTTADSTPFDGIVMPTLESLPDGNYRYLSGEVEDRVYSEAEVRSRGGSVFILKKQGNTVTGNLLPRVGLPGICVNGTVSGNTVTGAAYPDDTTDSLQDSARDIGETYEPYGSGALQISQTTRTENGGLYYAGAVLDLAGFSRVNAGSMLPPDGCSAGRTGFRDQR